MFRKMKKKAFRAGYNLGLSDGLQHVEDAEVGPTPGCCVATQQEGIEAGLEMAYQAMSHSICVMQQQDVEAIRADDYVYELFVKYNITLVTPSEARKLNMTKALVKPEKVTA